MTVVFCGRTTCVTINQNVVWSYFCFDILWYFRHNDSNVCPVFHAILWIRVPPSKCNWYSGVVSTWRLYWSLYGVYLRWFVGMQHLSLGMHQVSSPLRLDESFQNVNPIHILHLQEDSSASPHRRVCQGLLNTYLDMELPTSVFLDIRSS